MRRVLRCRDSRGLGQALRTVQGGHACAFQALRPAAAPAAAMQLAGGQGRRALLTVHAAAARAASPLLPPPPHRRGFATMIPVPQMGDSITEGELSMILGELHPRPAPCGRAPCA